MVKVKICGIRRPEDVEYLNRHMPDYAGFVFAESKRQVTAQQVKTLSEQLDKNIKKVGIFVNGDIGKVLQNTVESGLDILQIHGDESPEYIETLKDRLDSRVKVWKAIRVKDESAINEMKRYRVDAFVLDAYSPDSYGGLGKTFDWKLADKAKDYGNIVLAGGLNLDNVRTAIGIVSPFAVDISSGVETNGIKDEEKVKSFIYKARCNVY